MGEKAVIRREIVGPMRGLCISLRAIDCKSESIERSVR